MSDLNEKTNKSVAMDTTEAGPSNGTVRANPGQTSKGTKLAKGRRPAKLFPNIDEKAIVAELRQLVIEEKKKRLSGAGQRRYRYHRSQGKPSAEAYELAAKGMQETLSPEQRREQERRKRARPNSETPPDNLTATKRPKPAGKGKVAPNREQGTVNPSHEGPSYREAVKGCRIGLIHADHPNTILTQEQMDGAQGYILNSISSAPEAGFYPQFAGLSIKPGWLLITCLNENTVTWLEQLAARYETEQGIGIKAVKENDIPKLEVIVGRFPRESGNSEEILKFLSSQNPDFNARGWKTLQRKQEGSCAVITFSIDSQSMGKLRVKGMRACYKFSSVTFHAKSKEGPTGKPPDD